MLRIERDGRPGGGQVRGRGGDCKSGAREPSGAVIGADDEDGGEGLGSQRFDGGKDGEPDAGPVGDEGLEGGDVGGVQPVGLLHLLGLLADHDEEDDAEEDAGED